MVPEIERSTNWCPTIIRVPKAPMIKGQQLTSTTAFRP